MYAARPVYRPVIPLEAISDSQKRLSPFSPSPPLTQSGEGERNIRHCLINRRASRLEKFSRRFCAAAFALTRVGRRERAASTAAVLHLLLKSSSSFSVRSRGRREREGEAGEKERERSSNGGKLKALLSLPLQSAFPTCEISISPFASNALPAVRWLAVVAALLG